MEVTIQAEDLAPIVAKCASIAKGAVLIEAVNARVTITGTDTQIEASGSATATVMVPGQAVVPADVLRDVWKVCKGPVTIAHGLKGRLRIRCGTATWNLPILEAEAVPRMALDKAPKRSLHVRCTGSDLATAIGCTAFAVSKESTRYGLNGALIEHTPEGLTLVGTDGSRLARYSVPVIEAEGDAKGALLPLSFLRFAQAVSTSAHMGEVALTVDDRTVRLSADQWVLVSRLMDGEFPDYRQVIPHTNSTTVKVPRAGLLAALDATATVLNDGRGTVELRFGEERMLIQGRHADLGDASIELDTDTTGPGLNIGFAVGLLRETLAHVPGAAVALELTRPLNPLVIRADAGLWIVMPCRMD
jgi:DNA polymerase-3 subunit beta